MAGILAGMAGMQPLTADAGDPTETVRELRTVLADPGTTPEQRKVAAEQVAKMIDYMGESLHDAATKMGPLEVTTQEMLALARELNVDERRMALLQAIETWLASTRRVAELARPVSEEVRSAKTSGNATTGRLVAKFDGKGTQSTRPFKVRGPWEARWTVDESDNKVMPLVIFQAVLFDPKGEYLEFLANQSSSGDGSAFYPKPGEYFLKVNALSGWTLEIRELP